MTPIKAAIAAVFISTAANAYANEDLQIDNGFNGHIYLYHEPCDLHISIPITEQLFRGESVLNEDAEGEEKVEICWFSPKVNMGLVPEEYQGHVVRVVNVLAPDGLVYTIAKDRFEPKGTPPVKEREY